MGDYSCATGGGVGKCVLLIWIKTVEPLLWDTSIQRTPPFRGHKIWFQKKVNVIQLFESVSSIEGIALFSGNGHVFWKSTLI